MSEAVIIQYANGEQTPLRLSSSLDGILNKLTVAGLTVLLYDTLLTWEREVQCIWM